MRSALFVVADDANRLRFPSGGTDLAGFLQTANYNLGRAELELAGTRG